MSSSTNNVSMWMKEPSTTADYAKWMKYYEDKWTDGYGATTTITPKNTDYKYYYELKYDEQGYFKPKLSETGEWKFDFDEFYKKWNPTLVKDDDLLEDELFEI